jgi:hypothetical protein
MNRLRIFNPVTKRWFNVCQQGIDAYVVFYGGLEGQANERRAATSEEVAMFLTLQEAVRGSNVELLHALSTDWVRLSEIYLKRDDAITVEELTAPVRPEDMTVDDLWGFRPEEYRRG